MLPRSRRVDTKRFKEILKHGKSVRGEAVYLRFYKKEGFPSAFAFAVPAKEVKKASVRNKIKRRGRNIVKTQLPRIAQGYQCILFFTKKSIDKPFEELQDEIVQLFKKARIIQ